MEIRQAGFRAEGSWQEIVDHAQRVTRSLLKAGAQDEESPGGASYEDAIHRWETWRPRTGEEMEDELRDRTAEEASLSRSNAEAKTKGVLEDLEEARERLEEDLPSEMQNGVKEAADVVRSSAEVASRSARSAGRQALRAFEESLYRHLMTRVSPFYFDNELVSANLERLDQDRFALEVKVKDSTLKARVREHLESEDPDGA